jgi:alpha-galactosidase
MDKSESQPSRRTFLRAALCSGAALPLSSNLRAATDPGATPSGSSFLDVLRQPDAITAFSGLTSPRSLAPHGERWEKEDTSVRVTAATAGTVPELSIHLGSPATQLTHLHLRWRIRAQAGLRCLGDAWERSYGDLEWRGLVPNRVLPWYFLTFDGEALHGYGVQTQAGAFCFWQLDPDGVSLWADVRNGGSPVALGQRELQVATIITSRGQTGEPPLASAQRLCRNMCPQPRLPRSPIFGSNDWNYAYGHNTAEGILRDADLIAGVAPSSEHKPLVVIDDGWQDPKRFPDMAALSGQIRGRGLRPGLWIRPLRASHDTPRNLLLPDARFASERPSPAFDPTIPEALERILDAIRTPVSWGYEFIKHDFSTWELLGRWGFSMGPSPTADGWSFADRSRTTAEIIVRLYRALRRAAGDSTTILGCNTIGHLAAGLFESQRVGDDTSGLIWERTRRMGVNCLAFRMPQHRTFFHIDPDIVAFTTHIDWSLTRQWLDGVARSGVSLFVAPERAATGPEQLAALREAFRQVLTSHGHAEDWLENTAPQRWRFEESASVTYDWSGSSGACPFNI